MIKIHTLGLWCVFLLFFACGSSPSSGNPDQDTINAAQAALNRMDGGSNTSSQQSGPAQNSPSTQNTVVNTSRSKPAWVDSPNSVYSRAQYVAVTGHANDRTMAERDSLAKLVGFFGQSIHAEQTSVDTYQEAVRSGVVTGWSTDSTMQNTIRISASMDTLLGAEIREVWQDSKTSIYYAVAVMEKAAAARLYTEVIKANQNMIENLVTMSSAEKNSLDGFSRYQFAAAIANINISYGNVLRQLDAAPPAGLEVGETYRREMRNIAQAIPIGVRVTNDRNGKVQGAFTKAFTDMGFGSRSGGTGRYVLDVNVAVSEAVFPNNPNKFARWEIDARLTDNGVTILPFNASGREGRATLPEAENFAYMAAERMINTGDPRANPPVSSYANLLKDYLARLVPEKR